MGGKKISWPKSVVQNIMFPKSKFSKDDSQKFVTQSIFKLHKCLGTLNASPENFQNFLLNKLLARRPLTLIFSNPDVNNSCQQLIVKKIVSRPMFERQKHSSTQNSCPENLQNILKTSFVIQGL